MSFDAKICRSISTAEPVQEVQTSVDQSETWAEINLKKCKHLHIGSGYEPATYTMKSGQEQIEIEKVSSEKDLDVIMGKALMFSEHISTKINKATRNLGIVFRTFTYMDKEMFLNLYRSIVRRHLEYAVTVCTPTSSITGVISPDQNLETIIRMHIQRLFSMFRCPSYVSYVSSRDGGFWVKFALWSVC